MVQHFNIGAKKEINPFAKVEYVKLADCVTAPLYKIVNDNSKSVTTRKIKNRWEMLYPIESMDFNTMIDWTDTDSGSFKVRVNAHIVHRVQFIIEDDIMSCW